MSKILLELAQIESLPELLCFAVKGGYTRNNSAIIHGELLISDKTEEVIGTAY